MWYEIHTLNHLRRVVLCGDDISDHTEHCFHYIPWAGELVRLRARLNEVSDGTNNRSIHDHKGKQPL